MPTDEAGRSGLDRLVRRGRARRHTSLIGYCRIFSGSHREPMIAGCCMVVPVMEMVVRSEGRGIG